MFKSRQPERHNFDAHRSKHPLHPARACIATLRWKSVSTGHNKLALPSFKKENKKYFAYIFPSVVLAFRETIQVITLFRIGDKISQDKMFTRKILTGPKFTRHLAPNLMEGKEPNIRTNTSEPSAYTCSHCMDIYCMGIFSICGYYKLLLAPK